MKGYVRKYDDIARKRRTRRRKPPAGLDIGQMSVDALNRVVLEAAGAREKKAIKKSSKDLVGKGRQ